MLIRPFYSLGQEQLQYIGILCYTRQKQWQISMQQFNGARSNLSETYNW